MEKQDAIQKLATALFKRDKGKVLPLSMSVCEEYGMQGLCGNDCPNYGCKTECLENSDYQVPQKLSSLRKDNLNV